MTKMSEAILAEMKWRKLISNCWIIYSKRTMKINQFKNKLRKNITSLKIGGTNNTQNKSTRKAPTNTHQKSFFIRIKPNN